LDRKSVPEMYVLNSLTPLKADSSDREAPDNGRTDVALLATQPGKTGWAAAAGEAARPPVLDAVTGMLASDRR